MYTCINHTIFTTRDITVSPISIRMIDITPRPFSQASWVAAEIVCCRHVLLNEIVVCDVIVILAAPSIANNSIFCASCEAEVIPTTTAGIAL